MYWLEQVELYSWAVHFSEISELINNIFLENFTPYDYTAMKRWLSENRNTVGLVGVGLLVVGVGCLLDGGVISVPVLLFVMNNGTLQVASSTVAVQVSAEVVTVSTSVAVGAAVLLSSNNSSRNGTNNTNDLSRSQQKNLGKLDNIINDHLKESDFFGTLRDLQGNPVPKKGGGYWNHLQEMQDSLTGLKKVQRALDGSLKNPNLDPATRIILEEAFKKANYYIQKINDLGIY